MNIVRWLVDCGLTSHQQLRSYGDGPGFIVPSERLEKTGIERILLEIFVSKATNVVLL